LSTYPSSPALSEVTAATAINTTWGESIRNNINAIGADLVDARGESQAFPGTDHATGQITDVNDMLCALKHMVAQLSGQTNWYDDFSGSLKTHTHASGQGGSVPYANIGANNIRLIELYPAYPGYINTNSLRGAAASGSNTITITPEIIMNSNDSRHCLTANSAEVTLQDTYAVVKLTLPKDFTAFATSNAIQLQYITENISSSNCHVDLYVYKSGTADLIASSEDNAATSWSTITIDDSSLGSWSAGDSLELYIKLNSKSDYYASISKISLNYTS